jgi:hypothetical protein
MTMAERIACWAFIAWNDLWLVLAVAWVQNPALEAGKFSGGAVTTSPSVYPATKPPDWAMFEYWSVGFVLLATVWIVGRWRARRSYPKSG